MNHRACSAAALMLALLIPSPGFAELRQVDLKVLGMDWAVCAHAVRVAVQKLPGVDSVNVSLERANTEIRLRPGNSITLEQLRRIIKNNGFTSREVTVTVAGRVIERGGGPALDVTGTDTVMLIVPDPKEPAIYKQLQDHLRAKGRGMIRITGSVESRPDSPDRIAAGAVAEDK